MASINLLPWREAARKQQQLNYLTVLAQVAVLAFVLMFLVYWLYQARVEGQISRNSLLETEIQQLDLRIAQIRELEKQKAGLQQRMSLIEQLQRSRNLGTQIMDEVAKTVPAGVYLLSLDKKLNRLLITGKSESNNRLSGMLRIIEQSPLLTQPVLEFIQASKEDSGLLSDFKMHLRLAGAEPPPAQAQPAAKTAAKVGAQG
ncbi:pilus assembly protein PilN [Rheinheimera mesophila]|uniref:Pilus assembly protein PilN n=1 Tax=Rheinheimera mesophila TaxID=1547515 RepID=A0A3P3QL25_9GAMM|nr:PilN domain-containing protein [Rheinheimera mesophila]KKL02941.1 pilus assembly protein PilN [Rheinheimera mesophila]RRJ21063.1 pilus assembly protein PilN [Rheinheimera mesophila]